MPETQEVGAFFCVRLPQAKVTSIDGKAVGDQYLPSYLSISSWYSPSRCHIQIQSPSVPLKASITISSGANSVAS